MASSSDLSEKSNRNVVSFFAKYLCDSLGSGIPEDTQVRSSCKHSLTACLLPFATLFLEENSSTLSKRICFFIQRHHVAIASAFSDLCDDRQRSEQPNPDTDANHSLTLHDRTNEWLAYHQSMLALAHPQERGVAFDRPDSHAYLESQSLTRSSENREESEHDFGELSPHIPMIRAALSQSRAWIWLVDRITAASRSTYWDSPMISIIQHLENTAVFRVAWDPSAFLRDQYAHQPLQKLADAITSTTCSGEYYTTTCAEYLSEYWPTLGNKFLDILQEHINRLRGGSSHATVSEISTPHGSCTITIVLEQSKTSVRVEGCKILIIAVGEQLSWLSASCSCPIEECITSTCSMDFDLGSGCDVILRRFVARLDQEEGDCWKELFRGTVVAEGFPVPYHEEGTHGMRMSLDVMLVLGEVHRATVFNEKFMLKGFSSMYIPVIHTPTFTVWHFIYAKDGGYLPHSRAQQSCLGREAFQGRDASWLRSTVHYVGWISRAEVHTGTEQGNYDVAEAPRTSSFSNLALEKVSVGGSQYLSVGAQVGRGKHHIPMWSSPFSEYTREMVQASQESVLLYDTLDKRAWLVDGASALLHMTVAQLTTGPEAEYWSKDAVAQLNYARSTGSGAALQALLDRQNRRLVLLADDIGDEKETQPADMHRRASTFRFQDHVQDNWKRLSQILEQHALRPTGMELRLTARDRLAGWSFRSLVNSKALLHPRIFYIQSRGSRFGWVPFVKSIDAAVLVGSGFGEIIRPSQELLPDLCDRRTGVPPGQDIMAVTIAHIRHIAESQGCEFPQSLTENIRWRARTESVMSCKCRDSPGSTCDPLQTLTSTGGGVNSETSTQPLPHDGAVMFANWNAGKWNDGLWPFGSIKKRKVAASPTDTSSRPSDSASQSRADLPASANNETGLASSASVVVINSDAELAQDSVEEAHIEDIEMSDHLQSSFAAYRSFVYPDQPHHPMVAGDVDIGAHVTSISDSVRKENV